MGEGEMKNHVKITYTTPKQIPLFEELDNGKLKRFNLEE
jgi:hypothetical protein